MTVLQKTSAVVAIVNLIMDRVKSGAYKPDEKLPSERQLQDELGVGRLALREALSRLNAMGIIATAHGKGTYVQSKISSKTFSDALVPYFALSNPKRLRDLVAARSMLESEISGLAAQQRTEKNLKELEEIVFYEFPVGTSAQTIAAQDLLFHRTLADIADNSFLATMHKALTEHIRLFLGEYVKSKSSGREVMDAHLTIFHAVAKKDIEAARKYARMHISYSVEDYERYVKISKGEKS